MCFTEMWINESPNLKLYSALDIGLFLVKKTCSPSVAYLYILRYNYSILTIRANVKTVWGYMRVCVYVCAWLCVVYLACCINLLSQCMRAAVMIVWTWLVGWYLKYVWWANQSSSNQSLSFARLVYRGGGRWASARVCVTLAYLCQGKLKISEHPHSNVQQPQSSSKRTSLAPPL